MPHATPRHLLRAHHDGTPRVLGVIHLPPLPGAPRPGPSLDAIVERACADAEALVGGGVDGVVVENLGDTPFHATRVGPETVASMTRIALAVRQVVGADRALGINILRNDALSALAVAMACDADLIRVNVLIGAAVTDQGIIEGCARELADARTRLAAGIHPPPVAVLADVHVKHAVPLGGGALEDAVRDTWHRAGADGVILSGRGTGQPTAMDDLKRARDACPDAPLWVGSGVTPETARSVCGRVDGLLVGTWFHASGDLDASVDPRRVDQLMTALTG